nr:hypothetical protein [Rhodococcus sp. (in: high G+C Gram-positive bacteria)]
MHRVAKPHLELLVAAFTLFAVSGLMSACSSEPERSAAQFCAVMDKHKSRYLANMETATDNIGNENSAVAVIAGLGQTAAALGDLTIMWDELSAVAPEDIRADVEKIAKNYSSQMDSAGDSFSNPLGSLASGLTSGLTTSGSYQRVDQFVGDYCDGGS